MFLPRGNDVWRNLSTFFVDVDKLLLFLKNEEFIGFVRFSFPDTQSVILIQEGDAVGGVEEVKGGKKRRSGPITVKEIMAHARREKNGSMIVAELPLETVAIMSEVFGFSVNVLYEGLSSDFSDLGLFLAKLENDGFSGFIEIQFANEKRKTMIFLEKGKTKAIFSEKIQIGLKEATERDLKLIISKIIDEAKKAGARFDVFRSDKEA